jgi:hypothetical protein
MGMEDIHHIAGTIRNTTILKVLVITWMNNCKGESKERPTVKPKGYSDLTWAERMNSVNFSGLIHSMRSMVASDDSTHQE